MHMRRGSESLVPSVSQRQQLTKQTSQRARRLKQESRASEPSEWKQSRMATDGDHTEETRTGEGTGRVEVSRETVRAALVDILGEIPAFREFARGGGGGRRTEARPRGGGSGPADAGSTTDPPESKRNSIAALASVVRAEHQAMPRS